jgi:hypothetical protein
MVEGNGRRGNLAARLLLLASRPARSLPCPCDLEFPMTLPCPHCGNAPPPPVSPEVTSTEEMLLCLVREMRADKVSPSLEEMSFYMGYSPSNRSAVFNLIDHLIGKGLLVKERSVSSLRLTPAAEAFLAGRPLRSPGSRKMSDAARKLAAMDRAQEVKAAGEAQL